MRRKVCVWKRSFLISTSTWSRYYGPICGISEALWSKPNCQSPRQNHPRNQYLAFLQPVPEKSPQPPPTDSPPPGYASPSDNLWCRICDSHVKARSRTPSRANYSSQAVWLRRGCFRCWFDLSRDRCNGTRKSLPSRPPKDKPWYHVLVNEGAHTTYLSEQNLEPAEVPQRIVHPLADSLFIKFYGKRYKLHQKAH